MRKKYDAIEYGEMKMRERMKLLTFEADEDSYRWFENSEEGAVVFIKAHLITDCQKLALFLQDLSIEDILNGRFGQDLMVGIQDIFEDWNLKLGRRHFGF